MIAMQRTCRVFSYPFAITESVYGPATLGANHNCICSDIIMICFDFNPLEPIYFLPMVTRLTLNMPLTLIRLLEHLMYALLWKCGFRDGPKEREFSRTKTLFRPLYCITRKPVHFIIYNAISINRDKLLGCIRTSHM